MRILASGTSSGLGKSILQTLGGQAWVRGAAAEAKAAIKAKGADVIIHSAFNTGRVSSSAELYQYFSDNLLLTLELASIPHRKFIFISSVDVYPRAAATCVEDMLIDPNAVEGLYGTSKLIAEAIVQKHCPNHLILRCSTLLGEFSRKNSLIRLIEDQPCRLTLSGDSRFNYVLHRDVIGFISSAVANDLTGVFNIASATSLTLSEVSQVLQKPVEFGNYTYLVGNISNAKAASAFPAFRKSSSEVVAEFLKERRLAHAV